MCCTSPKCISCESYKFKPNETIRTWRKVWEDFSFLLWGGKHYGNRETVTKIFEPPKVGPPPCVAMVIPTLQNEVLERVIAVEKDIALIKDYLKQVYIRSYSYSYNCNRWQNNLCKKKFITIASYNIVMLAGHAK